jgi:hypothetical protein
VLPSSGGTLQNSFVLLEFGLFHARKTRVQGKGAEFFFSSSASPKIT